MSDNIYSVYLVSAFCNLDFGPVNSALVCGLRMDPGVHWFPVVTDEEAAFDMEVARASAWK